MKQEIKKAVYGGIVGTVVMTAMTMYIAPLMTGMPMDIAEMLGGMIGGYAMGMIAHIIMGVVVFPLAYVLLVYVFQPSSRFLSGLIFGVALWAAAVLVVMPMAGAGMFMVNIGGAMAVMASLMGHLVYGGLLGGIAGVRSASFIND